MVDCITFNQFIVFYFYISSLIGIDIHSAFFLVEIKTRVANATIEKANEQVGKFGVFAVCEVKDNVADNDQDDAFFKMIIYDQDRLQIIHHCTCLNVEVCLYVEATEVGIVRIVKVKVSPQIIAIHRHTLVTIDRHFMRSYYSQDEDVPPWKDMCLSTMVPDIHTLQQTIALRRKCFALVLQRREPLPKCKSLLPTINIDWNSHKGTWDTISFYLAELVVKFMHLQAEPLCFVRVLMMAIIQVHLLSLWMKVDASHLAPNSNHYKSMVHLRNAVKTHQRNSLKSSVFKMLEAVTLRLGQPIGGNKRKSESSFQVPEKKMHIDNKRNLFNSVDGCKFRTETGRHFPESEKRSDTRNRSRACIVCKALTAHFCGKCKSAMCIKPLDGEPRSCYAKFHTESII